MINLLNPAGAAGFGRRRSNPWGITLRKARRMDRQRSDFCRIAPTNRAAEQVYHHLPGLTPLSAAFKPSGKDLPPMLPWAGSAFALTSPASRAVPTRSGVHFFRTRSREHIANVREPFAAGAEFVRFGGAR